MEQIVFFFFFFLFLMTNFKMCEESYEVFFFSLKTNQLLDAFTFDFVVHWQAYPMFIGYSKIFSLLSEETSIQDTE